MAKKAPNQYTKDPATSTLKAPLMTDNLLPDQQRALRRAEALGWEIERANHALDVERGVAGEAHTSGVTPADMRYGQKKKSAKDAPDISQKEGQK